MTKFVRHVTLGCFILAAATMVAGAQDTIATTTMRANGAELTYVEQGSGTPVIFVHGALGDWRFWEPQRAEFAARHRFISYSFRYHGTGKWLDEGKDYSADTHAADLAAFISALKAGPAHIVGLSYGGAIAALTALRHPQVVRSLTLAEPGVFSVLTSAEDKPIADEFGKAFAPLAESVKAGDLTQAAKQLVHLVTGEPFDKAPAPLQQMLLDNARTLPLAFSGPISVLTCEQLKAIKAPTLLIRGERTPQIFVRTNAVVHGCIAGSRLEVIPGASHTVSYDNPAVFNRVVLEFVNSAGSSR